jgi:hypothetical protein
MRRRSEMKVLLALSAVVAIMTAGAVAQVPSPRTPPPPLPTPHLPTPQPAASSVPTPIRIDRGTDWGTADHGVRLTIEMSGSFKVGSPMPFTVFAGNFSQDVLRYDNCVSAQQAFRSCALFDDKGKLVKKKSGIAYPLGCGGQRRIGSGGWDTIVDGPINQDWVLQPGSYTFSVSTSIGIPGEKPMANVSARKTFTVTAGD